MNIFEKFYKFFQSGFDYIFQKWDRVSPFFFEHLRITLITLAIALLIALPLGLLISRVRWLSTPVLGILGILYTIPSLAFLAILIPVFGLTPTTTIVVLIVYAQTILVRNIALGFNGVEASVLEAARGMGMSRWQVLWKVELPLALPVIVAGIRIATLAIISIATVGAWAGADTLGKLFLENYDFKTAAGIILIAAIALFSDQIFRLLERLAVSYRHQRVPVRKTQLVGA